MDGGKKTRTDLKIQIPDAEEDARITAAAEADPDARPMTDEEWRAAPRVSREEVANLIGRPPLPEAAKKQRVTMYLDRDVLARLKAGGKGWQTRANARLREVLGL